MFLFFAFPFLLFCKFNKPLLVKFLFELLSEVLGSLKCGRATCVNELRSKGLGLYFLDLVHKVVFLQALPFFLVFHDKVFAGGGHLSWVH